MGILFDAFSIILGSLLGSIFKERVLLKNFTVLGISIMIISMVGFLENVFDVANMKLASDDLMIVVFSLIVGSMIGEVIQEIETAYSDIGILAIKGNDDGIMKRYLSKKGLSFTPFFKAYPHVFLRKEHPASEYKSLDYAVLKDYPYVSYEQGKHNNSFFAEEIMNGFCKKHIEISDRASLMNVLLSTNCYTIGTGIMPSALNNGNIVSIPFESKEFYTIGYILREDRKISPLTEKFIKLLKENAKEFISC